MATLTLRSKAVQLCLCIFGLLSVGIWYRSFREYYETHSYKGFTLLKSMMVSGDHRRTQHTLRQDGLLEVNITGRHPLWELIEDAEKRWDELHARFVSVS